MFNDNDGDLFGDFGSNDQPYETESNPDSKKYDFSKIQSDQIKEYLSTFIEKKGLLNSFFK